MKMYAHYGHTEFVVPLGYKGFLIKEYFAHYYLHESDVTFDFGRGGGMTVRQPCLDSWKVTLVDTGRDTLTAGRIRRIRPYLGEEPFMLTYGDGLSDVNIARLAAFHRAHGRLATVTAVRPAGRFGSLTLDGTGEVTAFREKPPGDGGWTNGGFFVFQPEALSYMGGDDTMLEREPLERLAKDGQLMAFAHEGFWQPMDTMRDRDLLEQLWRDGAPWKTWRDA